MSAESSEIVKFDIKSDEENQEEYRNLSLGLITLSDNKLVELIVKQLPPKRHKIAGNQIKIYINKIISHPVMRSTYIQKIKQLIIYEKNFNKNRVDLNNE